MLVCRLELAKYKMEVKDAYEKQLRLQRIELRKELEDAQDVRIKALKDTYTAELNSLKRTSTAQISLLSQKDKLIQKLYRIIAGQEY